MEKLKWYISATGFLCRESKYGRTGGWIVGNLHTDCSNTPKHIIKEMLRRLNGPSKPAVRRA